MAERANFHRADTFRNCPNAELRALTIAAARYTNATEFYSKCPNGEVYKNDSTDLHDALLYADEQHKLITEDETVFTKTEDMNTNIDKEKCKRETMEIDNAFAELVGMFCDNNEWSQKLGDRAGDLDKELMENKEGKLWWVASFGQENSVPWREFWNSFVDYLDICYGFPVMKPVDIKQDIPSKLDYGDSSRNDSSDMMAVAGQVENGVRGCLGKDTDEEQEEEGYAGDYVTTDEFKAYYQRFGPWRDLYPKSMTLCDFDGHLQYYFKPHYGRKDVNKYLKKNAKALFLVRFSSKGGHFVYQDAISNVLIKNSISGYIVVADNRVVKDLRDVPDALVKCWECDDSVQEARHWRYYLYNLNRAKSPYEKLGGTDSRYGPLGNPKPALTEKIDEMNAHLNVQLGVINDKLDDAKVQRDEMTDKLDSMREDIIKFGLKVLTHLDSEMPRVFYMEPGQFDDNWKEYFKKKTMHKWVIHFMCEGNRYFKNEQGDERAYKPHDTDHEGFSINLPSACLAKWLPVMRVALRVAFISIKATTAGINPCGEIVEGISEGFQLPDKLRNCEDHLKKLQEFHQQDSVFQIGKDHQQVMENYKLLHGFVLEKMDRDELRKGNCADLKLMWDEDKHKPIWVCEKHQEDLSELSDEDLRKLENGNKVASPVAAQQQPSDETKHQTSSQQSKAESPTQPPNAQDEVKVATPKKRPEKSKLTVSCLKGIDLPNVEHGKFGKSDPYCRITPRDENDKKLKVQETTHINNNLNPDWDGQMFEWTHEHPIDRVEIRVYDHNRITADVRMGQVVVKIKPNENGKFSHDEKRELEPYNHKQNPGWVHVKVEYDEC